jgi:hypothetical protein
LVKKKGGRCGEGKYFETKRMKRSNSTTTGRNFNAI